MYLALMGVSILFIFLNNIVMKYNRDVWCSDPENYKFMLEHVAQGYQSYQGLTHCLFTLVNLACYAVCFGGAGVVNYHYEEKKKSLILKKLKKA